jgi:hypothetical protein
VTAVEYLEAVHPDNGHALSLATMASASQSPVPAFRLLIHASKSWTSQRRSPLGNLTGATGHSTSKRRSDRPQWWAPSDLLSIRFGMTLICSVALDTSKSPSGTRPAGPQVRLIVVRFRETGAQWKRKGIWFRTLPAGRRGILSSNLIRV